MRAIMLELLLTTPAEEADRAAYLEQVSSREKKNLANIDELQGQLDKALEVGASVRAH